MELWQLNIIAVGVIALVTRKDMAVIAFCIMALAWLVAVQDYSLQQKYFHFCVLNSLLAVMAAAYNHINKCNLSVLTGVLASIACILDLIQMYSESPMTSLITSFLGWGLALAFIFMDGGKGLLNGLIHDCRVNLGLSLRSFSNSSNRKGRN
jgi:hypothetical protein